MKKICYLFILFYIISCVNQVEKKQKTIQKSDETSFIPIDEYLEKEINQEFVQNYIGKGEYHQLLNKFKDEISLRNISYTKDQKNLNYFVDSTVCINKTKDEIIFFECYTNMESELDAEYIWRYGKKINGNWYIFHGAIQSIYKPKDHSNTKADVHKWIKKETRGYLKRDSKGNFRINDEFFEYFDRLEKDTKTKETYPRNQLEKDRIFVVNSMREFYEDKMLHEVYKPKDFIFNYDKIKQELTITCPIKKWNEFPVDFQSNWYYNNYKPTEKDTQFVPMSQKESSCVIKNVKVNDDVYFVFSFAGKEWIDGVGLIYYHYKLSNGKTRFMGLVPDEADILDFPKAEQDSVRKARHLK